MFNSLTGIITAKMPQSVYLDVNGVEWDLAVPDSSLDMLPVMGSAARIFTWLYHREDAMKVFGFATPQERALFLDLQKVEGVGPKAALKILSNIPGDDLAAVLKSGDVARLEKVPGVGKKTAAKMMLALKGKLTLPDGNARTQKQPASPWEDVVSALVQMGYDRKMCETVIEKLAENLDTSKPRAQQEEQLFRSAIVELAV